MKSLILLLTYTIVQVCCAQDAEREYFHDWGALTTKDSASYYTEWTKLENGNLRTAYYVSNGQLKFKEIFIKNAREGQCIYYHKNGSVQYEASYFNNHPVGLVKFFYPDGKLQKEQLYDSAKKINRINEKQLSYKLINFYDSTGNWLTKNGFGIAYEYEFGKSGFKKSKGKIYEGLRDSIWVAYFPDGRLYYSELWNKGILAEGKSFGLDGKTYTYRVIEEMAEPANGIAPFYNYVGRSMRYPKEARLSGIEGRVFAEFIVEKDGSISGIKVIRGIGGGCDEEAVRVIGASPKWKAGLQRGQPVRTKFGLPIIFKLD